MRVFILALWIMLFSDSVLADSASCWPAWGRFKQAVLSDDGRVIDHSSERQITTSEGQSYGLFLALVANEPQTFARLLNWTEQNLADGNLAHHLPAWLWGHAEQDQWQVLDTNNASDADLWIAYSLLEAGRLWNKPEYDALGKHILWRSAAQTLRKLPGLGVMLLPGDQGFDSAEGWRLNPSYLPLQLLARFAQIDPIWGELAENSRRLLLESAPKGFAPDWVLWQSNQRWARDPQHGYRGSYDAIRVYLWLGMLAAEAPHRDELLQHFAPMARQTAQDGQPPEQVDVATAEHQHAGPVGFSAALLPLLANLPYPESLQQQRTRLAEEPPAADAYYNQMLMLFGQAWDQGRYRFDKNGQLLPEWGSVCPAQD